MKGVVPSRFFYSPSTYLARGIEEALIYVKEQDTGLTHTVTCVAIKVLGLVVFPLVLTGELAFESLYLVKALVVGSKEERFYEIERVSKLVLGILFSPLAVITADAVSYLFLERVPNCREILPFGVEKVYGTALTHPICYPTTKEEVQELVRRAKEENKKVVVIGTGLSQGIQTIPSQDEALVLQLNRMNKITELEDPNILHIEAGATFEEVHVVANSKGKSILVKQASDIFSLGGSLAINCHGWEHHLGAISSTIEELEVIDAEGNLQVLHKDDELFGCQFGTLGYFGVIVGAKMRLADNALLEEKAEKVELEQFVEHYNATLKGNRKVPLLIGRLNLDDVPLQELYVDTFQETLYPAMGPSPHFSIEPWRGDRLARIFLDAVGHLPNRWHNMLQSYFWEREVKLMHSGRKDLRSQIMHWGLKSFYQIHNSDLYSQWLQEYFIGPDELAPFLRFLGPLLKENGVRLTNASIRPAPKDEVSILPYAEEDAFAVVICFHQLKTGKEIEKTREWIGVVQRWLLEHRGKSYQAYMPYATKEEFELSYGEERMNRLKELKERFDPEHRFENAHTAKYYS